MTDFEKRNLLNSIDTIKWFIEEQLDDIREMPTDIVRCKFCKFWTKVERTYYVCNVQGCVDGDGNSCWRTLPSDFCSRGMKKDEID